MAKVITTIVPENGMRFDDICSFKTENYIGMWNYATDNYILMIKTGIELYLYAINKRCKSLKELDNEVFAICDEHITEVFSDGGYTIALHCGLGDMEL